MRAPVGKATAIKEAKRLRKQWCSKVDTSDLSQLKKMVTKKVGTIILEHNLDNNDDGVLVVKGSKSIIVLNKAQSSNRRRFTLMHEVCHLMVHYDRSETEAFHRDERSSQGTQRIEIEANAFAAEFLMPEENIVQWAETVELDSLGNSDEAISEKARELGVSSLALTIRLETLGLFRSSFM